MGWNHRAWVLLGALVPLTALQATPRTSLDYTLFPDAIAAAGGLAASDSFRVAFTLCEPTVVGISRNQQFLVWSGLALPLVPSVSDVRAQPEFERLSTCLHPNSPNPFSPVTRLTYEIGAPGVARITIYDVSGRKTRSLVSGEHRTGLFEVSWDGRDDAGHPVASGIYFAVLEAPDTRQVRRLILIR
jgi:hypothetical protein